MSLFGSPHKKGLSSTLHETFLKNFSEEVAIKKIHAYDLKISPCIGCGACKKESVCIFNDDMTLLYDELRFSDFLTFSWPLYFSSLPSPVKSIIDRSQLLWEEVQRKEFPEKKREYIYFITAGAEYKDMFNPSLTVVKHLTNILGYTLNTDFSFKFNNLDSKEGKLEYKKSLDKIKNMGSIVKRKFL